VSPYNEGVGFRFNREKMLARIPGVFTVWKNKVRKREILIETGEGTRDLGEGLCNVMTQVSGGFCVHA